MKILVIGLGSMGRRRIRLIRSHYPSFELWGIDAREDRRNEASIEFNLETFESLENAIVKTEPHSAFACTAPLAHANIVRKCLSKAIHTFSEINLVADGYQSIMDLATEKGVRAFLSSTPLYRKEIEYISDQVRQDPSPISYSYHVGQYLPDWHPWEDYRDFFVSDKRTNACREIMGIELPWILATFGDISHTHTIKRKISSLRIDYPDTFQILVEHSNGNIGQLFFNVVSRKATKRLVIVSEENFISWSGKADGLLVRNKKSNALEKIELYDETTRGAAYSEHIIEEPYIAEIEDFVLGIENPEHQFRYSYHQDMKVLELIDDIEAV